MAQRSLTFLRFAFLPLLEEVFFFVLLRILANPLLCRFFSLQVYSPQKRCTLLVPSRAMWPQPGRQRGRIAPCEVHPVAKGSYFHCVHGMGCFHPLAELHISEEQFSNNSRTREFVKVIFMFERCARSEPSFVCDLSAREINNSSGLTKLLRSLMQSPTFRNAGRSMHMMLHRFLGFRELTVHMIKKNS